jgi:hypothetical protein
MQEQEEPESLAEDMAAMAERGWTLQQDSCSSGTVHKFVVDEPLEGVIRGLRTVSVRRGKEVVKARLMTLLAGDGFVTVWESAALSGLFDAAKVGDAVCIEYLGEVEMPAPKSPMKDYRVWVRPCDEG